jgi:hypothetical protein
MCSRSDTHMAISAKAIAIPTKTLLGNPPHTATRKPFQTHITSLSFQALQMFFCGKRHFGRSLTSSSLAFHVSCSLSDVFCTERTPTRINATTPTHPGFWRSTWETMHACGACMNLSIPPDTYIIILVLSTLCVHSKTWLAARVSLTSQKKHTIF